MRNLYFRLGIAPTASPEKIRAAIQSCPHASIQEDAAEILLVPMRRRRYDALNSLLVDIGNLRAVLGLTHADNWDEVLACEYKSKSDMPVSQYEQFIKTIKARRTVKHSREESGGGFAKLLLIICAAIGFWLFYDNYSSNKAQFPRATASNLSKPESLPRAGSAAPQASKPSTSSVVPQVSKPVFNEPSLSTPYSGFTRRFYSQEAEAPLEIRTYAGNNYLVKLETLGGKDVMDIFVRGGSNVEVMVPLGTYIIKYVSGDIWYGYVHYFGPKSSYNKADSTFVFDKQFISDGYRQGYQITGHTITLYRVVGGNLSTTNISPEQF